MTPDPLPDPRLVLERLPGRFTLCRMDAHAALPVWADLGRGLICITRTDRELSILVSEDRVPSPLPADQVRCEGPWAALRVRGTLDFDQVGVLAHLSSALAAAGVPLLAISTFDTDFLLVRSSHAARAEDALRTVAEVG